MASALGTDFPNDYPPEAKWSIEIQPLQDALVGNVRPQLLALMAAVVLAVLIASVNIATPSEKLCSGESAGPRRARPLRLFHRAVPGKDLRALSEVDEGTCCCSDARG